MRGNEDCVETTWDGKWNDNGCFRLFGFICERGLSNDKKCQCLCLFEMLLRDLISFVQFKKREELPWRIVDFSYFYSFMGVFHILQIVETVPNSFNLLSILTDEDCGSWK